MVMARIAHALKSRRGPAIYVLVLTITMLLPAPTTESRVHRGYQPIIIGVGTSFLEWPWTLLWLSEYLIISFVALVAVRFFTQHRSGRRWIWRLATVAIVVGYISAFGTDLVVAVTSAEWYFSIMYAMQWCLDKRMEIHFVTGR